MYAVILNTNGTLIAVKASTVDATLNVLFEGSMEQCNNYITNNQSKFMTEEQFLNKVNKKGGGQVPL